jgi:type II secretory pathway component PulF
MLLVLGSLILFIAVAILFPVWDSLGKVSAI